MKSAYRGLANMLKVRNAVKMLMDVEGRCPTGGEVSRETGFSIQACMKHMHTIEHHKWIPGFEVRDKKPLADHEKRAIMDEIHGTKKSQFYLVIESDSW